MYVATIEGANAMRQDSQATPLNRNHDSVRISGCGLR